jgi:hypothetical protein
MFGESEKNKKRFLKENSDQRKRIAHFEPLFWFVISLAPDL